MLKNLDIINQMEFHSNISSDETIDLRILKFISKIFCFHVILNFMEIISTKIFCLELAEDKSLSFTISIWSDFHV